MLDTSRWSGGNTALDALALPLVALPGRHMRARQSAAMLRQAGVPELIVGYSDDCVRIGSALAGDRDARDAFAARLREGRERVFDDLAPVRARRDHALTSRRAAAL